MRKKISSVILGLSVVALGVGFIGNGIFDWGFDPFVKDWWAALICFFCILSMISDKPNLFNVAGTIIFGMIFAENYIPSLENVSIWAIIGGAVVVGFGIDIIRGAFKKGGNSGTCAGESNNDDKMSCNFGKSEQRFNGKSFDGGKFSCAFGSYTIDLRGATITSDSDISLECAFGAMTLIVPRGTTVSLKTSVFLGSISCNVDKESLADININAESAFGSVNIIYG